MLGKRVAVGHPGNKVGDVTNARGLVAAGESFLPFRRQVVGVSAITGEQVTHDVSRFTHHPLHAFMTVHAGPEKLLDGAFGLRHRRRESGDA